MAEITARGRTHVVVSPKAWVESLEQLLEDPDFVAEKQTDLLTADAKAALKMGFGTGSGKDNERFDLTDVDIGTAKHVLGPLLMQELGVNKVEENGPRFDARKFARKWFRHVQTYVTLVEERDTIALLKGPDEVDKKRLAGKGPLFVFEHTYERTTEKGVEKDPAYFVYEHFENGGESILWHVCSRQRREREGEPIYKEMRKLAKNFIDFLVLEKIHRGITKNQHVLLRPISFGPFAASEKADFETVALINLMAIRNMVCMDAYYWTPEMFAKRRFIPLLDLLKMPIGTRSYAYGVFGHMKPEAKEASDNEYDKLDKATIRSSQWASKSYFRAQSEDADSPDAPAELDEYVQQCRYPAVEEIPEEQNDEEEGDEEEEDEEAVENEAEKEDDMEDGEEDVVTGDEDEEEGDLEEEGDNEPEVDEDELTGEGTVSGGTGVNTPLTGDALSNRGIDDEERVDKEPESLIDNDDDTRGWVINEAPTSPPDSGRGKSENTAGSYARIPFERKSRPEERMPRTGQGRYTKPSPSPTPSGKTGWKGSVSSRTVCPQVETKLDEVLHLVGASNDTVKESQQSQQHIRVSLHQLTTAIKELTTTVNGLRHGVMLEVKEEDTADDRIKRERLSGGVQEEPDQASGNSHEKGLEKRQSTKQRKEPQAGPSKERGNREYRPENEVENMDVADAAEFSTSDQSYKLGDSPEETPRKTAGSKSGSKRRHKQQVVPPRNEQLTRKWREYLKLVDKKVHPKFRDAFVYRAAESFRFFLSEYDRRYLRKDEKKDDKKDEKKDKKEAEKDKSAEAATATQEEDDKEGFKGELAYCAWCFDPKAASPKSYANQYTHMRNFLMTTDAKGKAVEHFGPKTLVQGLFVKVAEKHAKLKATEFHNLLKLIEKKNVENEERRRTHPHEADTHTTTDRNSSWSHWVKLFEEKQKKNPSLPYTIENEPVTIDLDEDEDEVEFTDRRFDSDEEDGAEGPSNKRAKPDETKNSEKPADKDAAGKGEKSGRKADGKKADKEADATTSGRKEKTTTPAEQLKKYKIPLKSTPKRSATTTSEMPPEKKARSGSVPEKKRSAGTTSVTDKRSGDKDRRDQSKDRAKAASESRSKQQSTERAKDKSKERTTSTTARKSHDGSKSRSPIKEHSSSSKRPTNPGLARGSPKKPGAVGSKKTEDFAKKRLENWVSSSSQSPRPVKRQSEGPPAKAPARSSGSPARKAVEIRN